VEADGQRVAQKPTTKGLGPAERGEEARQQIKAAIARTVGNGTTAFLPLNMGPQDPYWLANRASKIKASFWRHDSKRVVLWPDFSEA